MNRKLLPLLLSIGLAACSSTGSTSADSPAKQGGNADKRQATTLTAGQMRAALIGTSDVPAGYKPATNSDDESAPDSTACGDRFNQLNSIKTTAKAQVEVSFDKDAMTINETIAGFATDAAAQKAFSPFKDLAKDCPAVILSDKKSTLNAKVTAVSVGRFGDASTAFNISGTVSAFPISIDFALVRAGRTLMVITQGGLGVTTDRELTKAITAKAFAKLQPCLTGSCSEVPESALPTPSVLESVSPSVAKSWTAKWCQARIGMTRDDMRALMGNPTEEFDLASGNPQMSWDAFEFQFNAFLNVDDKVRQLDVNDISLNASEKASIKCELTRQ